MANTPSPFETFKQEDLDPLAQMYSITCGSTVGSLGSVTSNAISGTASWGKTLAYPQYVTVTPQLPNPVRRLMFHRINEEVYEGSLTEPLDELRLKVAKWLGGVK